MDTLPSEPHEGKRLKGDKQGSRSLRVGDFRIIYDLYPAQHAIHIIRVGDRKEIYR
ncbi:MAG: type II toxin-antitoxin system RelE/ParE family toxin [Candidatus Omnitrophica bacterium]|nr:type II toxin-antitoxin system RelE/ParE family toxin [Candidatus Omnitrophota bacterium]